MARELDELFGEGLGQPRPRKRLVWILLVSGLFIALAGMACSAVPGGVVVLLAWLVVDKELDRVDSGYLPATERPGLESLRWMVYAGVLLVVFLFVTQGLLFCGGFYDPLWETALGWFVELVAPVSSP